MKWCFIISSASHTYRRRRMKRLSTYSERVWHKPPTRANRQSFLTCMNILETSCTRRATPTAPTLHSTACLQWKEDNVECLNNYAYYISVSGGDLSKAEHMSYKTVKAEPTNKTFLDTYAWVLYCMERYAEAQIYIEQAIANDTTNSDVLLDHAGDIYIKLGETDKAIEMWKKAISAGGDAQAIEQKIRYKKYIPTEK